MNARRFGRLLRICRSESWTGDGNVDKLLDKVVIPTTATSLIRQHIMAMALRLRDTIGRKGGDAEQQGLALHRASVLRGAVWNRC